MFLLLLSSNIFFEILALSFLEKIEEKNIYSDSKIPIIPRVTIDRLSYKKVSSFFKLSVAFLISIF